MKQEIVEKTGHKKLFKKHVYTLTSRPLDATSVATNILVEPDLNLSIALSLIICVLSPCRESAVYPNLVNIRTN